MFAAFYHKNRVELPCGFIGCFAWVTFRNMLLVIHYLNCKSRCSSCTTWEAMRLQNRETIAYSILKWNLFIMYWPLLTHHTSKHETSKKNTATTTKTKQQPNHSTTQKDTYNKTWALKDPSEQRKTKSQVIKQKNNGGEDEAWGEGKKQRMHFQQGAEGCSAQKDSTTKVATRDEIQNPPGKHSGQPAVIVTHHGSHDSHGLGLNHRWWDGFCWPGGTKLPMLPKIFKRCCFRHRKPTWIKVKFTNSTSSYIS